MGAFRLKTQRETAGKYHAEPGPENFSPTWLVCKIAKPDFSLKPSLCIHWQVKATDGGSPPLSSSVRLHISWVSSPGPSSEPLAFDEPHFNFAVMETDPVNHMVGVISVEMGPSQLWFNITGEAPVGN